MTCRVLVVSPVPSHPGDQGNSARIQALAAQMKERSLQLELFYYGMEGLKENQRAEMEAFWHGFHFLQSLPLPEPSLPTCWGLDDWCPDIVCKAVHALHERRRYDAVLVNYVWMSRVLVGLQGTVRIIDTHDLFGDRHLISLNSGLEPRWFFTSLAEEDRGFRRADLILGIQDKETASIRSRVDVAAMTVGHHVDPRFLLDFEAGRKLARFGYIGSRNPWNVRCIQNLDAALGDDANWLVAGSLLQEKLALKSNPYRLGFVKHLDDFYRSVDCIVNPMLGGTGLKIKTVEALAYGMAVIGTVDAFEGIPTRHPAHRLANAAECAVVMSEFENNEAFRQDLQLECRSVYITYMMDVASAIDRLVGTIEAGIRKSVATS